MNDKTRVENIDCMVGMKESPDKYFDLAIVDPPYGLGENGGDTSRHHTQKKYVKKDWDNMTPEASYFSELLRVSKHQIVWGANHFISKMPYDSSCWIYWDKDRYGDFADGELAWTSFTTAVRHYKFTWDGFRKEIACDRIHPTEKPVSLYKWLLKNYAKEGDKILDTHGGSMSSVIACLDMGYSITCYEMDTDYYNQAKNRITNHLNQLNAFRPAYDIEFHDNSGVSRLRNQQGVGHQKQKDSENTESIHRIDGLFHGDTTQQCDEKSKAASGT